MIGNEVKTMDNLILIAGLLLQGQVTVNPHPSYSNLIFVSDVEQHPIWDSGLVSFPGASHRVVHAADNSWDFDIIAQETQKHIDNDDFDGYPTEVFMSIPSE
jgi:hypothetical protein